MAGRTLSRWIRFVLKGADATMREIPVDGISGVTVNYDVVDVSAWQDPAKGFLPGMPVVKIVVTGPYDTTAAAAMAGTGAAPTLSGSHTILSALYSVAPPQCTGPVNISLGVLFGDRAYWASGAPVFGVVAATAVNGFWLSKYEVNPNDAKYSAEFDLFPGSTLPAWGTTIPS
jgi:hypothetical protein